MGRVMEIQRFTLVAEVKVGAVQASPADTSDGNGAAITTRNAMMDLELSRGIVLMNLIDELVEGLFEGVLSNLFGVMVDDHLVLCNVVVGRDMI